MQILESDRITLRHFEREDLDNLFALYADPQVTQFIPDAPRNLQETQKELEWFLGGHPRHPQLGLWAAIHKQDQAMIGRCGLLPWTIDGRDEVEVAFLFARSYWEQGLGTEVGHALVDYGFQKLNLDRLVCLIDQANLASIKVAEKIGMQFEKEGADEMGPFLLYVTQKMNRDR